MPKAYEPQQFEDSIYAQWEESGSFIPENLPDFASREPYTIVVPPPNATATLHIGHASMLAIEDSLIRYHRMNGKRALWIPGTDHAALATQNVVEKMILKEEKKTRHDLGREELVRRIDDFVDSKRDRIKLQFRKMGASLDWSREAFTLDEERSLGVRVMFQKMFKDGLIYRGKRVINWCSRCASTLSDDEVESKARKSVLYYFKYGHEFPVTIASTQPETKLGDAAIAVHPSDERYTAMIGKTIEVPFGGAGGTKLSIRVIADHNVEKEFGSGALGVTPAHSNVDYQMALQHDLPLIQIIGEDGRMTAEAGRDYAGLTLEEAREKVVAWLRAENLIEKEEEIDQNVPVCSRCETEILPLPKLQWFVDVNKKFAFKQSKRKPIAGFEAGQMVTLKDTMRHAVATDQVNILPERFDKTYFNWVDNLRDWCISRQIWYGHRIPVWYCEQQKTAECAEPICSVDDVLMCPHCNGSVTQDPDALDTWFSSGMWTFSTLGWPYTRVIFVRHGQAWSNVNGVMEAEIFDAQNGLTDEGKKQVAHCGDLLVGENPVAIIASPVLRTKETAEILSEKMGLEIRFDDRIREVGTGDLEGKTIEEFLQARGPLNNWYSTAQQGIEPYMEIKKRSEEFMQDLLEEFKGRTVVVVTHGATISLLKNYGVSAVETTEEYPVNGHATIHEFDASGSQVGDLQTYHPNDVLETGYDILSNWVARMILMTTYALGEVPFKNVYLHGLVRDAQGRKMSKSLGNGIDPLDVIPKYGTDAVRLALLIGQTPGNDLRVSEEKIAGFRNFTNKLWNISRFIVSQDSEERRIISQSEVEDLPLTTMDKWLLSRFAEAARTFSESMEKFEFSRAGEVLRDFTWNELADWYLEGAKVEGGKIIILHYVLQNLLKLWHPYMPFVTEVIWQATYAKNEKDFLMIAPWPEYVSMALYPEAEREFSHAQNVITAIRALKNDYKVPAGAIVPVTIVTKMKQSLALHQMVIEKLSRCEILFADAAPEGQLASVIEEGVITIPKPESTESPDEKIKLEAERDSVSHYIETLQAKLSNEEFVGRAPAAVIEKERAKLAEAQEKLSELQKRLQ